MTAEQIDIVDAALEDVRRAREYVETIERVREEHPNHAVFALRQAKDYLREAESVLEEARKRPQM